MPISTDLSVSPYFDDYLESKKFVRELYKPDTAVQARELNQAWDLIQAQIERLGNNLFKRGTIIDGCNFVFYDNYQYIKVKDARLDGETFVPSETVGFVLTNQNGLTARVIDYEDGFETTDPDLKTLYLVYTNSGTSYTDTSFASDQILTISDTNNSIFGVSIIASGAGYSNTDALVFTPVLLANVNSGSLTSGDTITDTVSGARGVVISTVDQTTRTAQNILQGTVSVASAANVVGTGTQFTNDFSNGDYIAIYSNTTNYVLRKVNVVTNSTFMNLTSNITFSNTAAQYANATPSQVLVSYAPYANDLSNSSMTATAWTFTSGNVVQGSTSATLFTVEDIIGENASASITTDASGRIKTVSVQDRGTGYSNVPYVSVKSSTGTSANLVALNYYGQVTVSTLADSVGSGYAFGVTSGYIYQKGYFLKVDPQTIIVDKYSRQPNNVTVGFTTLEEIINSNIDDSLFDNSSGFKNVNAPGADRLRLTPTLAVANSDSANSEFFHLVEWSGGYPYKQNQRTSYNVIQDDIAEGIEDVSGDFVVDPFLTTTTSPANSSLEANSVNIVVDPGIAYVGGYRVETKSNFVITTSKATNTKSLTNSKTSLNYDAYVRVNNLGGAFEFNQAAQVQLYDTAKGFLSNNSFIVTGNTTPVGNNIGTARIRNFVYEQGTPGSPNAIYRLYLFNIQMNPGYSFRNVQSIYNNGSIKGIADVQLEADATTNTNLAILYANNTSLLFPTGFTSPLGANNIDYTYRAIDETQSIANTGVLTITLSTPNQNFPYTGTLSDSNKLDIYLAPQANLIAQANLTGTVSVNTTSGSVVGTGTNFVGQLKAGSYLYITGGATNTAIRRITSITNSTFLTVESNLSFTQSSLTIKRAWPMNVPIQLAYNSNYTANVTGAGFNTLNINLGDTLNTTSNTNVIVTYNVEVANGQPTPKTVNRGQFVQINMSNNQATSVGPWCLGVPDIFRLDAVYMGNSSVLSTSSPNVTSDFFIDHGQNSSYYGPGYLYQKSGSSLILSQDTCLLVKFDCFTAAAGFYTINSYVSANATARFGNDSLPLANLSTSVNTLEIPEVFDDVGNYYDLINCIDFRPYAATTANVTSNTAQSTVNPANTISFSATNRFFPLPDSLYRQDVTYFLPRIDTMMLDKSKQIKLVEGLDGSTVPPTLPTGAMRLNDILIPAYPSIPANVSNNVSTMLTTSVYNNKYIGIRLTNQKIQTLFTSLDFSLQQPQNYTELDIGSIDRRLQAVEYYVSFNLMQNAVLGKTIPSSVSPQINRFKYGFFVDDYTDTNFSETTSPEYNAAVLGGFALPPLIQFNTVHSGGNEEGWTQVPIVSQGNATDSPSDVIPTTTNYVGGMTIVLPYFKSQTYSYTTTTSTSSSSSGGGGKIVCTAMNEAYGFGSFRQAIWLEHSKTMAPEYELGYHKLFLPVVNYIYYSKYSDGRLARSIRVVAERIARKRTADIWKQKRGRRDVEGAIYRTILEPICYIAGWFTKWKAK